MTPVMLAIVASCMAAASCSRGPGKPARSDGEPTSFSVAGDGDSAPEACVDAPDGPGSDSSTAQDSQAVDDKTAGYVPAGNIEKGEPPDPSSAVEGARLLLEAIKADDPSVAASFFFPGPAFDLVKNIADPSRYHARLWKWFGEDVHAEHGRYFGVESLEFDRLEMGKCAWTEPYTEGNRLPYWSCRRSRLIARSPGGKTLDFEIRVIISWGERWHVIHLGPVRK